MLIGLVLSMLSAMTAEVGCLPAEAGVDQFKLGWFCKQLNAAQERQLAGDPAYRFAYIPSFHPTRVAVAFLEAGKPVVVGKILSGKGGHEPGTLVRTTRRSLSADEWRLLEQRLQNAGLWEETDRDDRLGLDGAQWVLEGRRHGRYKFHDVWSPDDSTHPQYRKACAFMLELAGIKPPDEELY